jgi:hypothetical protein
VAPSGNFYSFLERALQVEMIFSSEGSYLFSNHLRSWLPTSSIS